MVSVEVLGADGSFKTYDLGPACLPPRLSRSRVSRRRISAPACPDVKIDTGPATWKDTSPFDFNRKDDPDLFVDDGSWYEGGYDMSDEDRIHDKERIRFLRDRGDGRRNRQTKRMLSSRRFCEIVRDVNGEEVKRIWRKGHKMGDPSGRKLRRRDIKRETVRHMQPAEILEYEWLDELPLPDMGMVSRNALAVEESMIWAAEYNSDDRYVEEIMLTLDELIEEAA